MNTKVHQTFFADKLLCGSAEIIIEFARFVVIHSSELHTVLVVLPVVWLVGCPREEVLRSRYKHHPHCAAKHEMDFLCVKLRSFYS